MNLIRIIISIVLLTLVFGDVETRRIKSKSRNSIRKSHQKSKNEKHRKHKNHRESQRERRKMSRNAFRNSEFTKSLEHELIEEFEDDDYDFYDAPIIKIRFKRDSNFLNELTEDDLLLRKSLIVQKILQKF